MLCCRHGPPVFTAQREGLRIRMMVEPAGQIEDRRCRRGHVLPVAEGEMNSAHGHAALHVMKAGMSCRASNGPTSHRSRTAMPARARLFDGGTQPPVLDNTRISDREHMDRKPLSCAVQGGMPPHPAAAEKDQVAR